jgi:hypothetical protein
VPCVPLTGGWIPLGVLRQRVLLPYALSQADHDRLCALPPGAAAAVGAGGAKGGAATVVDADLPAFVSDVVAVVQGAAGGERRGSEGERVAERAAARQAASRLHVSL